MADNVIALRGTIDVPSAKPNAHLVEELERLLEAARSGEILGMAGAYLHKEKGASYSFAGMVASFGLIGGLECAKARLLSIVLDR